MTEAELLADAFERIKQNVHSAVEGLDEDDLSHRIDGRGNSIAWLVWHLARVQDDHVAGVAYRGQVWPDGWYDRFGLPLDPADHGYGHSADQVATVRVPGELLRAYHDAVYQRTLDYVRGIQDADLDRVVDTNWDPPVTLGVRLVSVVSDDLQHAGQAAYVKGLLLNS